jgi:gamma-glutamyltranspeptidase / glutathione hydrolase
MNYWRLSFCTVLACVLAPPMNAHAQADRTQARSMVVSRDGIVAAESPLAAQAGATILAQGGNAIDAAVAANAAMSVVSPLMNGMGGDLFAIVYEAKTGKLYGLNASGWSPAGLTIDYVRARQSSNAMPQIGINAVTVPGAVDGWDKLLKRFGKKKFAEVLAPAIHLAETGFPVAEWTATTWTEPDALTLLHLTPNATRTFLPGGRAPVVGEVFKNPDLAWSLRQVASSGRDAFYRGKIAQKILACCRAAGGPMTAADLSGYSSEWVEPISTTYHGWTVVELPPNGQGVAALSMLNLMEGFPLREYGTGSAEALHIMIEAKKLAFADLQRYVGDPKFSQVPVAGMISKDYARQRAALIDTNKANSRVEAGQPPRNGGETTYLCVVDRDGNMVSYIQSNYDHFGSGLVPDGAGFVLQNRGGLFSLDKNSPNALEGHKRPLHTLIPGFMSKGNVRIAFGIMGGYNQAQAQAQFVSDIVDGDMNIQAALEAPRFTKKTFPGNDVQMERRVPEAVRAELAKMGHQILLRGDFNDVMGGGQAVMRDFGTGVNFGASDPRKDGAAVPEARWK